MNFNVKYIFHLVDRFSNRARKMASSATTATGRINRMGAAFGAMEKRVNRVARSMRSLRTVGKNIAFGGFMTGLGGTFLLRDIIRTNFQFSDIMNEVVANMQASDKVFRPEIESLAQQVARNTRYTVNEVGRMALELARMGNSAQQIMEKLPVSAEFATAAGIDPGMAIDRLTNFAQVFGYKGSQLRQVADLFTKGFTNSPQTFHDMGEALKFAGPVASSLGISLKEVVASTMTLARSQLKGSLGGTSIARSLEAIFKSSGPAAKALKKIGITKDQFIDQHGKFKSTFLDMLKTFREAGEKFGGKALQEAIQRTFGARGARGFRILIANIERLEKELALLEGAGGATARASGERMQGLAGALRRLSAAWTDLKIAIGKAQMNEDIVAIADAIRDLIGRFKNLDATTQSYISRALLAAGAFAALVIPIGLVIFALGAILTPLGLVVLGIVALAAAVGVLIAKWDDVVGFFQDLGAQLQSDWTATLDLWQSRWDSFVSFLESIPDRLFAIGQRIANAMSSLVPSSTGWGWLDRTLGLAETATRAAGEVEAGTGRSETAAATTRVTEGKLDITSRVESTITAPPEITLRLPDGAVAGKIPLGAQTAPKGQNMPKGGPPMADSVTAQ